MHLLVDQTPGLEWKSSKLKKGAFTVERDEDKSESTQKLMARLQLAVEARRKLIERSAQLPEDDTPEGWTSDPPPAESAPQSQSPEDKAPDDESGQDWLQTQLPDGNAPERLSRLARRIEERRR